MELAIILGYWLLVVFYGCIVAYIATESPKRRETNTHQTIETTGLASRDFSNMVFSKLWFQSFWGHHNLYGIDGRSPIHHLNRYLGAAVHYNFAIPVTECRNLWRDMIKDTKPQSPTRRWYYPHIPTAKPFWHSDKAGNIVIHNREPYYPAYYGRGFGYVPMPSLNGYYESWFDQHYTKYPDGILPEQKIEKHKAKRR